MFRRLTLLRLNHSIRRQGVGRSLKTYYGWLRFVVFIKPESNLFLFVIDF